MIIDSHCHLDFPQFDADREEVLARAVESGVTGVILIGVNPDSWEATAALNTGPLRAWRTAGLHPNSVATQWSQALLGLLTHAATSGELVGIGETGVDLFRSQDSRDLQMQAFDEHLKLSQESRLPVVIHQRNAQAEVLEVLHSHGEVRGVMHCFGGDWQFAEECLDIGLHLGIGGVATYKSSHATRDVVSRMPAERILLETDAPYLAPQAVRGKRNEPAYLRHVVDVVAACRDISAKEVEELTTKNVQQLFGLAL